MQATEKRKAGQQRQPATDNIWTNSSSQSFNPIDSQNRCAYSRRSQSVHKMQSYTANGALPPGYCLGLAARRGVGDATAVRHGAIQEEAVHCVACVVVIGYVLLRVRHCVRLEPMPHPGELSTDLPPWAGWIKTANRSHSKRTRADANLRQKKIDCMADRLSLAWMILGRPWPHSKGNALSRYAASLPCHSMISALNLVQSSNEPPRSAHQILVPCGALI